MKVTLLPAGGIGRSAPIVFDADLVLVAHEDGTPILAAGLAGPDGSVQGSCAGNPDFNETLRKLGINRTVVCDRIEIPKLPKEARIVAGPRNPY